MGKHWYVIHTYSGHENKVRNNLEKTVTNEGMEESFGRIVVATEDIAEMKDGKRVISRRKTFPSYVLIEMEMNADTLALVSGVPGVTRFVGSGQDPVPLNDEEVNRLLGQIDESAESAK